MRTKIFVTVALAAGLAGLTACAGVERNSQTDGAEPREVTYTTGSNLPNRDRRNQNIQQVDKATMEEAQRRAQAAAATGNLK